MAFSSHPKLLATLMGRPSGRKFEDVQWPYLHQKILGNVWSLYRNFKETFFINNFIFVLKKAQPPKIVGTSYVPNTFNGYPDIFKRFSRIRHFYAIFAPLNSYFKEKSPWVPMLVALF